jgi:hypothetical protein
VNKYDPPLTRQSTSYTNVNWWVREGTLLTKPAQNSSVYERYLRQDTTKQKDLNLLRFYANCYFISSK